MSQAIDCEKKFKSDLLRFAKNRQYDEIVSSLRNRKQQRYLTNYETYILLTAEAILKVIQTKTIPIPTINSTLDMYEALIGNNFKLALELNKEFIDYARSDNREDIINVLLIDLNMMISELKEDYDSVEARTKSDGLGTNNGLESSSLQSDDVQKMSDLDKDILDAQELASYIVSENMTLDVARRRLGLNLDTVLLIKLIRVRDCYISGNEENILEGDFILQEVEACEDKSEKVLKFLEEVKSYKTVPYKKVLVQ